MSKGFQHSALRDFERNKEGEEERRENEAEALLNHDYNQPLHRSSFVIRLVFVFKDLDTIYAPLGVPLVVLCIFISVVSLNNDWFNSNKLNSINHGKFFFLFLFRTIIHFTVIKFRRKLITIES